MRILLVEDELELALFIRQGLQEQGYKVDVINNGLMANDAFKEGLYAAVILDVMLPGLSGLSLCRIMRKKEPNLPILILTALDAVEDKVLGFDAGADDYICKPFEFLELLVRLKVVIRRSQIGHISEDRILTFSDLTMNLDTHTITRGDLNIDLTAKEYILLEYFMRNKGRVLSRIQLAEHVWDSPYDPNSNVIDVYVSFLRKKIDKGFDNKLFHTISKVGYVLRENNN